MIMGPQRLPPFGPEGNPELARSPMPTLSSPAAAVNPTRKPAASSRPVERRRVRWLYRQAGDTLKGVVRVAITSGRRTALFRYWVQAVPADFGAACRLVKINPDGSAGEVYHACAEGGRGGHCDCLGHQRHGHCKHLDMARAIPRRDRLS